MQCSKLSKSSRSSRPYHPYNPSQPCRPCNSYSPAVHHHLAKPATPSIPWQVGKYQSNSGTQNALKPAKPVPSFHTGRSHSSMPSSWPVWPLQFSNPQAPQASQRPASFNSNSESQTNSNLPSQRSKINYQCSDYDLISHTKREQAVPASVTRQKGLGQVFDALKPSRQEFFDEYQKSILREPKIFYKKVGEFSKFQDNCVRLSGKGPFCRGI